MTGESTLLILLFIIKKIYSVCLWNIDEESDLCEDIEKEKEIHDRILIENGILNGCQYGWGDILSECDRKGGGCHIGIYYSI